jgi:hypothetical protein
MKVLAAADVHGIRPVYDWLLAAAQGHDVEAIVLAGDLLGCLDGFETPEAAQQYESAFLVDLLDTGLGLAHADQAKSRPVHSDADVQRVAERQGGAGGRGNLCEARTSRASSRRPTRRCT